MKGLVHGLGVSGLAHLTWVFFKVGFVFFGGGFLLIPTLHRELVVHLGWLSPREFVDGVAMSQLTPGPVAILATFCGYARGGTLGAVFATMSVFTPAFVLMIGLTKLYDRMREMEPVRAVMSVLPPVIIGLLLAAALDIGKTVPLSPLPIVVGIIALAAMLRYNVNPAILIILGCVIGVISNM